MATRKPKTWSELLSDIDTTMRKWSAVSYITVDIANDLAPRSRQKRWQTSQEREVRLRFTAYTDERREVRADVRTAETATENLRLIAMAVEMMRLAEVRGVHKVLALLYRQMYPPALTRPSPPPQIPPHYAVLHLSPDAPLVVAEAVYRTLAKQAHPDAGGSTDQMQRLNAAIEQVRKERT